MSLTCMEFMEVLWRSIRLTLVMLSIADIDQWYLIFFLCVYIDIANFHLFIILNFYYY